MVLNADLIKIGDVDAEYNGECAGHFEAIVHVALSYALFLLKVIAVLYLLLHTVSISQQRNNFVAVRVSGDCLHDVVSEVGGQTFEDWIVGEKYCLSLPVVVGYLNTQQKSLQMLVHAFVFLHASFYLFLDEGLPFLRVIGNVLDLVVN